MKNRINWPFVTMIAILISAVMAFMGWITISNQHAGEVTMLKGQIDVLKLKLQNEQARKFSDTLPGDIAMQITIVTGDELNPMTMVGDKLATLKPYRYAILRWDDLSGFHFAIVREKEADPEWFAELVKFDGGHTTLPPNPPKGRQI